MIPLLHCSMHTLSSCFRFLLLRFLQSKVFLPAASAFSWPAPLFLLWCVLCEIRKLGGICIRWRPARRPHLELKFLRCITNYARSTKGLVHRVHYICNFFLSVDFLISNNILLARCPYLPDLFRYVKNKMHGGAWSRAFKHFKSLVSVIGTFLRLEKDARVYRI